MGAITSDVRVRFPARTIADVNLFAAVVNAHDREKVHKELIQVQADLLRSWIDLTEKRSEGYSEDRLRKWERDLIRTSEKALA